MEGGAVSPSAHLARAKGEMLPRQIVTSLTTKHAGGKMGEQCGKAPHWVLKRLNADESREQRTKGEM